MQSENRASFTKDRIKQFHRMKLPVPSLPTPRLIKEVDAIASQLSGMPRTPSAFEIDAIYKRMIIAIDSSALGDISLKDWKMAAYVLWYGNRKLGSEPPFLDAYLDWLKATPLPSNWRRLIYVYLRDYSYKESFADAFSNMAKAIRSAFKQPDLKQRLEKWVNRQEAYTLFSDASDLKKSTRAFYESRANWDEFAEATGLDGELGFTGYADAVGMQMLNEYKKSPNPDVALSFLKYQLADKKLRFAHRRVAIIEGLLSPWLQSQKAVDEQARKAVQEWLLIQFNDPRLPIHANKGWQGVGLEYKKVMYRWLVGESLNQFFEIIDRVAQESHWKYRKAFWKAYYDAGVLDEAWVALGPDAKYYAERIFGERLSAGELQNLTDKKHSVLVVRIGDLVLADWSHNGKCRAWKVGDKSCPETYKSQYSGFALKAPSMKIVDTHLEDGISHQGSENYRWQSRLAEFIYDQTGIRIQQRDFRI